MISEIFIVSGFLGAGKTTLIQKLLQESFQKEKVALIENDFGEISVDAALLKSGNVEVREINSGCICCSLSGDFVRALKKLLDRFHPDKIIIEPSGVGKLSDIVKACTDPRIQPFAQVKTKITVADVKRCKMYLKSFGEFFEDQIQNADVILLSRTEDFPDQINDAYKLVKSVNAHSDILLKPWNQINAAEILQPYDSPELIEHCGHVGADTCGQHTSHNHGENGHCCGCHDHDHRGDCKHHHTAEDIFDTVTIRTKRIFSIEDLKERILDMERKAKGTVLRAKGIVRSTGGYINLQYLPEDIRITECAVDGDMLCIIGRGLNRQELIDLFSGDQSRE
ncbi:MAG: GTP-binding protein [Ruminococcaceae bacterium]|nr:GTP-binding protein [Oscillospiraceae bacterium]